MTTFYNFTLKIETNWAQKTVKSILETEMSMILLCMFVLFISGWKKLKIWNVKKNNFKCTKFTIKN